MLCIKLVNYWDKYTEMHGHQNVKICETGALITNTNKTADKNESSKKYCNCL